jgi:2-amino-4-hydroxy-6-hydroxymethyldihydropteridine diphosphokinase
MTHAYVALGSNLGDRAQHLERALRALRAVPGVLRVERSAVYETDPVGPPPQGPYLNAVARLTTRLEPHDLLDHLMRIEREAGRVRGAKRDLPRSLDLDLLLYGRRTVRTPELVVPRPRMHERAFVLEPFCDLAAALVHPTLGETIEALAERVRDPAAVRRIASGRNEKEIGSAASP